MNGCVGSEGTWLIGLAKALLIRAVRHVSIGKITCMVHRIPIRIGRTLKVW